MKSYFPSLYLNIGKSYEKLNDLEKAKQYYESAASFIDYLSNDGYGNMLRNGIGKALERIPSGK